MSAYDELLAHYRQTAALASISGRLEWDQETVMPRGAVEQRAEEVAALEAVLHERRTDPRLPEWLDRADAEVDEYDTAGLRNLELIRRGTERASRIPARLAVELARLTSLSQGIWAEARAQEAVADFLPTLSEVVALKREEGQALAAGGDAYDALLEDYEPHTSAAEIAAVFDAMRPSLVALRDAALGASYQPKRLTGRFPSEAQLRLARDLGTAFGYDWSRGRMDQAVHPFSSGGWQDARVTTRVVATDPFNCLYSIIHEVGHACYELGVDSDYAFTPLGGGVSMGVHESQSRIFENQMGRSRAFTGWLFERMTESFGDLGVGDADGFFGAANKLKQGYIRTESDEVQYNLHVMLRFDLERALIDGRLAVEDLPEAWNARFLKDFGFAVDKPSNGMLQDVHWSVGLFGYFPTYALGNVYAGCLNEAMQAGVPQLNAQLAEGDATAGTEWLRENVQRHGSLMRPREVIENAAGRAVSPKPLLDYLDAKFGEIYRL